MTGEHDQTDPADDILRLGIDVELVDTTIRMVLRGQLGAEDETLRVLVTPTQARYLSSRLLGAAAVVDPVGHQAILDGIAQMVGDHAALMAWPAGGAH